MKIAAGELTQLVSFQRMAAPTKDGAGGQVGPDVWNELRREFAKVQPKSGTEKMGADRVEATAGYWFGIRARRDILESDRFVWRDRAYNIRFVPEKGPRDLFMVIECDLGVAV